MTLRSLLGTPISVALVTCSLTSGCARTFYTSEAALHEAEQVVLTTPAQDIAIPASSRPEPAVDPTWLRYSKLTVMMPTTRKPGSPIAVRTPNHRRKWIAGIILASIGGSMIAGGLVQVVYGAKTDDLGIIAGLAGLPIVMGTSMVIPGALLIKRNRKPFDILSPGLPGMHYVPAAAK
ncbi:MAG TPA: hypothetical protein VGB85_26620 [Nannocystis sp.]